MRCGEKKKLAGSRQKATYKEVFFSSFSCHSEMGVISGKKFEKLQIHGVFKKCSYSEIKTFQSWLYFHKNNF